MVLESAISALGHLGNLNAIPTVLTYQDHPGQDVRFAEAFALGCFPNDAQSVRGLTKLTIDPCSDVRDWAVFGLGVQGDCDSPEIRETLLRCLNDTDEDVREEAAVGLGKRQDQRLIPKLRAMLDQNEITFRVTEAATGLLELNEAAPEWTPANFKAALIAKFKRPTRLLPDRFWNGFLGDAPFRSPPNTQRSARCHGGPANACDVDNDTIR
jgi:HEAT repeat protein